MAATTNAALSQQIGEVIGELKGLRRDVERAASLEPRVNKLEQVVATQAEHSEQIGAIGDRVTKLEQSWWKTAGFISALAFLITLLAPFAEKLVK
jgi:hypothetical protein